MAAEETPQSRVAEALRFLNVVCTGLLLSVGAFVVVAWFVSSGPGGGDTVGPPVPEAVAYAGVLVGIGLLVAAPIVHRKMVERAAVSMRDDERVVTALESYRLATLLGFILREGAAIVGLMLTLLTNEPMWCYVLAAMAVVAMIWGWPRQEQLAGLLGGEVGA